MTVTPEMYLRTNRAAYPHVALASVLLKRMYPSLFLQHAEIHIGTDCSFYEV